MLKMKTSEIPSRIPIRKKHLDWNHNRTTSAPSKLERLAEEYQQRIILEKQEKLLAIYQNQTNYTLQRVQGYQQAASNPALRNVGYGSAGSVIPQKASGNTNNNGMLREFFQERRQLEHNPSSNRAYHANIQVHYQQKRAMHNTYKDNAMPSGTQYAGTTTAQRPPLPKNRVGRDKAHPLQPLQRQPRGRQNIDSPAGNTYHSPKPPPFEKKPKMARQHRRGSQGGYTSGSERDSSPAQDIYDNLPSDRALIPVNTPPHKMTPKNQNTTQQARKMQRAPNNAALTNGYHGSESQDDTPPSSGNSGRYRRWKMEQMRVREERQRSGEKQGRHLPPQQPVVTTQDTHSTQPPHKMTDFQKWQQEQDEERNERLRKYSESKGRHMPSESPDPNNNRKISITKRSPSPHRNLDPISNHSTARTPKRTAGGHNKTANGRQQKKDTPEAKTPEANTLRQRKLSILKNTRVPSVEDSDRSDDDDDEETQAIKAQIKAKEEELRKMIVKQQKELEDMKKKNEKEDEEERIEKEKRAKRIAQQRERQRALRAAERVHSHASQVEEDNDIYGNSHQGNHSRNNHPNNYNDTYSRNSNRKDSFSSRSAASPEPVYKAPIVPKTKQPKLRSIQKHQAQRQPTPDNENTAFYLEMAATDGAVENIRLEECPSCGRKFAEERLAKHIKVCGSGSKKTRKVFDPVKMRTEGTDMAKYQGPTGKTKREKKPAPKSNWRTQHENFIKSIRYAKKVTEVEKQGGNVADLPPPPVTENPDYKQCPYCERTFNPTAAERHIPKCKDIKARPAPLKQRRR